MMKMLGAAVGLLLAMGGLAGPVQPLVAFPAWEEGAALEIYPNARAPGWYWFELLRDGQRVAVALSRSQLQDLLLVVAVGVVVCEERRLMFDQLGKMDVGRLQCWVVPYRNVITDEQGPMVILRALDSDRYLEACLTGDRIKHLVAALWMELNRP